MRFFLDQCINHLEPISIIDLSSKSDCSYLPLTAIDYEKLATRVTNPMLKSADGLWLPITQLYHYLKPEKDYDVIFFEAKSMNATILKLSEIKCIKKKKTGRSILQKDEDIPKIIQRWKLEKKIRESFIILNKWMDHGKSTLPIPPSKLKAVFYIVYEYDLLTRFIDPGDPESLSLFMDISRKKDIATSVIKKEVTNPGLSKFNIQIIDHVKFLDKFKNPHKIIIQ